VNHRMDHRGDRKQNLYNRVSRARR
jgi:hypothetical protein